MKPHYYVLTAAALASLAGFILTANNRIGPSYIYPDVPGAISQEVTQENIHQTICVAGYTKTIRPPTSYTKPIEAQKVAQYNARNHTHFTPEEGELDHVISLQLGGHPSDLKNLTFQPYDTYIDTMRIGAKEKDAVETYLKRRVCEGTLPLKDAQEMIVRDWYAVYLGITNPHIPLEVVE